MPSLFKSESDEAKYYACYDAALTMFEDPYESLYVNTSYGQTHVLVFGDKTKPPLLLLHGMIVSSTMWYPNIKAFIAERCVYAVDVLGDFGKSKVEVELSNRKSASDWLFEVIEGLNLTKIDLAGHSNGGFLALNFVTYYPSKVNLLILYSPVGSFHKVNSKFFLKIFPALLLRSEKLTDKAFQWFSATNSYLPELVGKQVRVAFTTGKPLLKIMPIIFLKSEFSHFNSPTLLIVGDKEVIYPYDAMVKVAKDVIQQVEIHVIEGANHLLTLEQAEKVNNLTIDFLKQANDRSSTDLQQLNSNEVKV